LPQLVALLFLITASNELWELYELIQGHFKGDQAKALLHVADELGWEFTAEPDLCKDILDVRLNGDVLVNHRNLLSVKRQFTWIDCDTCPEVLHFTLDTAADCRDAIHLAHWGLHPSPVVHCVELLDTLDVRLVFANARALSDIAEGCRVRRLILLLLLEIYGLWSHWLGQSFWFLFIPVNLHISFILQGTTLTRDFFWDWGEHGWFLRLREVGSVIDARGEGFLAFGASTVTKIELWV
jgi:hypothetical protein